MSLTLQSTYLLSVVVLVDVTCYILFDLLYVSVTAVNARYRNATKGLLGRLNSDVSDDFQSRNGTVYNISISSREYHYNVGQTCMSC